MGRSDGGKGETGMKHIMLMLMVCCGGREGLTVADWVRQTLLPLVVVVARLT